MSTLVYLFAGFATAWVLVFAYLWMLARRSQTFESRLDGIERRLGGAEK